MQGGSCFWYLCAMPNAQQTGIFKLIVNNSFCRQIFGFFMFHQDLVTYCSIHRPIHILSKIRKQRKCLNEARRFLLFVFRILQCFIPSLFHREKFERVHVGYILALTNGRKYLTGMKLHHQHKRAPLNILFKASVVFGLCSYISILEFSATMHLELGTVNIIVFCWGLK